MNWLLICWYKAVKIELINVATANCNHQKKGLTGYFFFEICIKATELEPILVQNLSAARRRPYAPCAAPGGKRGNSGDSKTCLSDLRGDHTCFFPVRAPRSPASYQLPNLGASEFWLQLGLFFPKKKRLEKMYIRYPSIEYSNHQQSSVHVPQLLENMKGICIPIFFGEDCFEPVAG